MPDFEQKIRHCYHNQFFVTKDMGKKNFHRNCPQRNNLSWFVRTLTSAKTKHLPKILNCRHFDAVCFYGNIMVPIPSPAEITQVTWIMRSHFAAVLLCRGLPRYRYASACVCADVVGENQVLRVRVACNAKVGVNLLKHG